jgi:hypothetical protein
MTRHPLSRPNRVIVAAGSAFVLAIAMVASAAPAGAANQPATRAPGYGHARRSRRDGATPHVLGTVSVSPSSQSFSSQRAGTFSGVPQTITITNTGATPVTVSAITVSSNDYGGSTTCFDQPIAVSGSCTITNFFFPTAAGPRPATLSITDDAVGSPQKVTLSGTGVEGYYVAGAGGEVAGFGDAHDFGNATNVGLTQPIISIKTTTNGDGYWLLASDGGIFSYGNAHFYGSTGAIHLNKPVVGMERTVTGKGYWLVASDGGIFSYGDAKFYGSTGAIHLNQPVVGMARTPTGHGYWLVARDGGIFSYGDAKFYGSTGAIHLNQPIVGMVARPNDKGYWMVAKDGGQFAFGDAPFYGSAAASGLTITGMAPTPDGHGYWMVATNGAVFHYGNAAALGDLPSHGIAATDVVGFAPTTPPLPIEFF